MHRFTGVVLFFLLVAFGFAFGIAGLKSSAGNDLVLGGWNLILSTIRSCCCFKYAVGVVLFGILFSLFYHLLNGIRYMFWSFARGMSLRTVTITAYIILFSAVIGAILSTVLLLSRV